MKWVEKHKEEIKEIVIFIALFSIFISGLLVSAGGADNPWGQETVPVAINNTANNDDFSKNVKTTLEYWRAKDDRYGDYQVNFTLVGEQDSADIEVRFVSQILMCGYSYRLGGYSGCAPALNANSTVTDKIVVKIVATDGDCATTYYLKHEFGHLLGINHGDPPKPLMNKGGSPSKFC